MMNTAANAKQDIRSSYDMKSDEIEEFGEEGKDDYDLIITGSPDIYGSLTVHGNFSVRGVLDIGYGASGDGLYHSKIKAKKITTGDQVWLHNNLTSLRQSTFEADEIDLSRSYRVEVARNTQLIMKGRHDGSKTKVTLGDIYVAGRITVEGHASVSNDHGIVFSATTPDQGVFSAGSMTWEDESLVIVSKNAYGSLEATDANRMALNDIKINALTSTTGSQLTLSITKDGTKDYSFRNAEIQTGARLNIKGRDVVLSSVGDVTNQGVIAFDDVTADAPRTTTISKTAFKKLLDGGANGVLYLGATTDKTLNIVVLSGDEVFDLTEYLGHYGAADGWLNANQTAGDNALTTPLIADGTLHVQGKGVLGDVYRDSRLDLVVDDLTTKSPVLTVETNVTAAQQMTLSGQEVKVANGAAFIVERNLNGVDAVISTEAGGRTAINTSGNGVMDFAGVIHTAVDGQTALKLGSTTAQATDGDISQWTVTDDSNLTSFTLGRRALLNFRPSQDLALYVNTDASGNRHSVVTVDGGDPVLLVSDAEKKSGFTLAGGWNTLKVGDEINLVKSKAGFALDNLTNLLAAGADLNDFKSDLTVTQTYSLARQTTDVLSADRYDLSLKTADQLIATIKEAPVPTPDPSDDQLNPETGALMESSLSAYGTFFAADDLLVDTVLRSRNGGHEGAFAAARAGRWHIDTNTTQKTNIVSGLVGYAAKTDVGEFGTYLEMGHSSYKTKTPVDGVMETGSGKHNYAGLGLYANVPMPVEGWQVTGYLKAGALENNFDTTLADQKVNFDRTSAYWGVHLGTHYDFETADFRLRPFVSYFYDGRDAETYRQAGHDGVKGSSFRYDTLEAHRVQVGTMAEYRYSDQVRPYFGLTYEQVLSVEAKGHASDAEGRLNLKTSDMEGGMGILSAGWTYENTTKDFSCEFGMNGFAGTRRGVSAQIQADWRF